MVSSINKTIDQLVSWVNSYFCVMPNIWPITPPYYKTKIFQKYIEEQTSKLNKPLRYKAPPPTFEIDFKLTVHWNKLLQTYN